ncbi:DNA repair protein RadC [Parvularcula bermudensis HTCC2503]|uniref:DNA repair protein RadC n=1 Tax=Parvularcula bermudensis (strain ATCC BAA-594 / HTCC2503 / KCTC 12087) TaxID=314260 RepID=E0TDI4_PARBH|nr:DNA repair protein RadC [Parvularcula bermudensis]ADM08739.1 DNA repair protein RadC [Parvularcula bermudensis HTCC2503]
MAPPDRSSPTSVAAPGPTGHRQRLKSRFRQAGVDGIHDYELLELILFAAIPRKDVKPLAKALLSRFGTVADVLSAPRTRLLEVKVDLGSGKTLAMTDASVDQFHLIKAAALRLSQQNLLERPVLSSWDKLLAYVRAQIAYETVEQFRVLYLNAKNVLIADEVHGSGTVNQTPVYPREVVKRALHLDASALILIHNHPSGDPTPSTADIKVTAQLVAAAATVGVTVHDHLVIGREGHASFKSLGLL